MSPMALNLTTRIALLSDMTDMVGQGQEGDHDADGDHSSCLAERSREFCRHRPRVRACSDPELAQGIPRRQKNNQPGEAAHHGERPLSGSPEHDYCE